jgi:signal transduction histidine kinase/CheY-like chemotaxis protein
MNIEKPWETSLSAKLVISFLCISLAFIGLMGLVTYVYATSLLEESVYTQLEAGVVTKTEWLNSWVHDQIQAVVITAWLPGVREQVSILTTTDPDLPLYKKAYEEIHQYISLLLTQTGSFDEVFLVDNSGRVLISTDISHEGIIEGKEPYFIEGLSKTRVFPITLSEKTGKPDFFIVTPIFTRENLRAGLLVSRVSLSRVEQIIGERTGVMDGVETYLVDKDQYAITRPAFTGSSKDIGPLNSSGIYFAVSGMSGKGIYKNYLGVPVIGVYRWIDDKQVALISEMNQEKAFLPARNLAVILVIIGILISLALLISIYLISLKIAEPILAITDAAIRMEKGDYHVQAPVMTRDEVGTLAESFNNMVRKCTATMEELAFSRENLEIQVRERTQELERSREKAEAASRSKSLFLANMSHEIKTPLNAIIGFSSLLTDMVTEPLAKKYIRSIHTSGRILLMLINDILDMSRIEAGKLIFSSEPTDPAGLCMEIVSILEYRAQEKGLDFICSIQDNSPVVFVDMGRIRQVLLNILTNAIKFTETGFIRLSFSYAPVGKDLFNIWFTIQDSGVGIPKEDQQRIFTAFEQQNSRISKDFGGTGLGLAISNALVTRMGGTITVESEVGKGSTFTITLPSVRGYERETAIKDDSIPKEHGTFSPARVVLVIEHEDDRSNISGLLSQLSLVPIPFGAAGEALNFLLHEQADLIITDVSMTGMSGSDLYHEVKKLYAESIIPIIGVIEPGENTDHIVGFREILIKPVSILPLMGALKRTLLHTHTPAFQEMQDEQLTPFGEREKINREISKDVRDRFLLRFKKLKSIFTDESARTLAQDMHAYAEKHHIQELSLLAQRLSDATDAYDFREIEAVFAQFQSVFPDQ